MIEATHWALTLLDHLRCESMPLYLSQLGGLSSVDLHFPYGVSLVLYNTVPVHIAELILLLFVFG